MATVEPVLSTREAILAEASRASPSVASTARRSTTSPTASASATQPAAPLPLQGGDLQRGVPGSLAEWAERVEDAVDEAGHEGWNKVDYVITAGFRFFEENPEFVRIMRREALEGGAHLGFNLGAALRPCSSGPWGTSATRWTRARFRTHDPEQLLLTGLRRAAQLLLRRAVPRGPART